jgi:hypothetical protein
LGSSPDSTASSNNNRPIILTCGSCLLKKKNDYWLRLRALSSLQPKSWNKENLKWKTSTFCFDSHTSNDKIYEDGTKVGRKKLKRKLDTFFFSLTVTLTFPMTNFSQPDLTNGENLKQTRS